MGRNSNYQTWLLLGHPLPPQRVTSFGVGSRGRHPPRFPFWWVWVSRPSGGRSSVKMHGLPRQFRALELTSKLLPMNKTNRKLTVTPEPTQAPPLELMHSLSDREDQRSPAARWHQRRKLACELPRSRQSGSSLGGAPPSALLRWLRCLHFLLWQEISLRHL